MKKVLAVIPDNIKAEYISKGFARAFRALSFFVYERKAADLDAAEAECRRPEIVFIFWSDSKNNELIAYFLKKYKFPSFFIHYSERMENIPQKFHKKTFHYTYAFNSDKNERLIQAVNADYYETDISGFKMGITFAGNPAYAGREQLFACLIKNFGRINIFCRSFDFYKSLDDIIEMKLLSESEAELYKNSYKGYASNSKELAGIYASSKINLDMPSCEKKDINCRLLEITASGGFALAPHSSCAARLFDIGRNIETYKNSDELIDKIRFYLKHSEISKVIAENGKDYTKNHFSCIKGLKIMLKEIYGKDFNSR